MVAMGVDGRRAADQRFNLGEFFVVVLFMPHQPLLYAADVSPQASHGFLDRLQLQVHADQDNGARAADLGKIKHRDRVAHGLYTGTFTVLPSCREMLR